MVFGGLGLAIIVGIIVWLLTANVLFGILAFLIILAIGGGGYYGSRRW